ncbi:MAG: prolipoprotein diacylglyceryl transferase [Clostridia bacterium]|nr:prolipoprotein diacylglyceryl transferase [Clostridia bacterium]
MYHVVFKIFEKLNDGSDVAFEFSPTAFTVFGKDIVWYAILITLGMVLSALYAFNRGRKLGIKTDYMYDYAIFTIILGVIGARLYYVLTSLDKYTEFSQVFEIWNGGLGIYGGIIGGAIAIVIVSLFRKINILTALDAIAPSVMIGQAIGRWGNYFNQEAFGCNTDLPWGMKSWVIEQNKGFNLEGTVEYLKSAQQSLADQGMTVDPNGYVHPTFLYESLWNVIGFIIIHFMYKKRKFKGQMFLMYITWYGLGRAFIEMLRTDSLYIPGTPVRISMAIGAACFAVGLTLLIILGVRAKKNPPVLETPIPKEPRKSKKNKEETLTEETEEVNETAETLTEDVKEAEETAKEDGGGYIEDEPEEVQEEPVVQDEAPEAEEKEDGDGN